MTLETHVTENRPLVLLEALQNTGALLGLNQTDIGEIVGKSRFAISRGQIDPDSKAGELALLFIRCYRSLHAHTGGSVEQMRHWLVTPNRHTGGVPLEQMKSIHGLTGIVRYLDALRVQ